jgi:hypothetical protein
VAEGRIETNKVGGVRRKRKGKKTRGRIQTKFKRRWRSSRQVQGKLSIESQVEYDCQVRSSNLDRESSIQGSNDRI